jgi:uncharacterized RDD family membrane protein YckC
MSELEDVLRKINREKYPDRLAQVEHEIKERLKNPEIKKQVVQAMEDNKYKTFWRRLFAQWIDGLVLMPLGLIGMWIMKSYDDVTILYLMQVFNSIAFYVYTISMHGAFGQTCGKMACGVMVMDKSEKSRISFHQAFMRDFIPLTLMLIYLVFFNPIAVKIGQDDIFNGPPILFFIFGFLNLIWSLTEIVTMLSNKKRRALHDFIAGSVVVCI